MAKLFLHSITLTVDQLQPPGQGRYLYFADNVMQQLMHVRLHAVTGFKDFNSNSKTVLGALYCTCLL